jgi:hypothetical protein
MEEQKALLEQLEGAVGGAGDKQLEARLMTLEAEIQREKENALPAVRCLPPC